MPSPCRRKVKSGLSRGGILRNAAIFSGFKQHQLAGDNNTGCQHDIQARLTVMSERHANRLCDVYFALCIRVDFLGDKYVINGFSHEASSTRNNDELNSNRINSAFRFKRASENIRGTLNCGYVTARTLFLKSST